MVNYDDIWTILLHNNELALPPIAVKRTDAKLLEALRSYWRKYNKSASKELVTKHRPDTLFWFDRPVPSDPEYILSEYRKERQFEKAKKALDSFPIDTYEGLRDYAKKVSSILIDEKIEHGKVSSVELKARVDKHIKRRLKTLSFLPGFNGVMLTPNTLTLFAAESGAGKTLFMANLIIWFLRNLKRVLFLNNEENEEDLATILWGMDESLCTKAIDDGSLFMIDLNKSKGVTGTPEVLGLIQQYYKDYDLIVLDQVNYCYSPKAGKMSKTQQIEVVVDGLRELINGKDEVPPIVVTQQIKSCPRSKQKVLEPHRWYSYDPVHGLRDSTRTFERCTFAIFYAWESSTSEAIAIVKKVRVGHEGKPQQMYYVDLDATTNILKFREVPKLDPLFGI